MKPSHAWLTDTAGGSSALSFTFPAFHLALHTLRVSVPSQRSSTCLPHMELLRPVSWWEQRTQTCKNDYFNPVMSELCVISCSGLLAKWSHLSQKKSSPLLELQGANSHLLSETVRKAESVTAPPQLAFQKISDPAVANSCTRLSAPQNWYPRCQLMKSNGWFSGTGCPCTAPTTLHHYSAPEQQGYFALKKKVEDFQKKSVCTNDEECWLMLQIVRLKTVFAWALFCSIDNLQLILTALCWGNNLTSLQLLAS